VSSHIAGKRQRNFFETKKAAEGFVELKEIELLNQGKEGALFSTEDRILYQRAAEILKPFNKTVVDGAEFMANHLTTIKGSRTVSEVVSELLAAHTADGLSADYLNDLKIKYKAFAQRFGARMIAGIVAKEVSDWLRELEIGIVSRNTTRSRLATLFGFAKRRGYSPENPVLNIERAKERGGEIGILKVEQITALLGAASDETLPYWAIGAFAGLRSAEIVRLEWNEVDFDAGLIEVKALKSKTGSRRLVTMQPNLKAWLAPYHQLRGKVSPIGLRKKLDVDRRSVGFGKPGTETKEEKEQGIRLKPWPSGHSHPNSLVSEYLNTSVSILPFATAKRTRTLPLPIAERCPVLRKTSPDNCRTLHISLSPQVMPDAVQL
jgi:integrase